RVHRGRGAALPGPLHGWFQQLSANPCQAPATSPCATEGGHSCLLISFSFPTSRLISIGGSFDSFNDPGIPAAAAEIRVHLLDDLFVVWMRMLIEQRDGIDDHAAGAVAALIRAFVEKGLLHGMKLLSLAKAVDRRDL